MNNPKPSALYWMIWNVIGPEIHLRFVRGFDEALALASSFTDSELYETEQGVSSRDRMVRISAGHTVDTLMGCFRAAKTLNPKPSICAVFGIPDSASDEQIESALRESEPLISAAKMVAFDSDLAYSI